MKTNVIIIITIRITQSHKTRPHTRLTARSPLPISNINTHKLINFKELSLTPQLPSGSCPTSCCENIKANHPWHHATQRKITIGQSCGCLLQDYSAGNTFSSCNGCDGRITNHEQWVQFTLGTVNHHFIRL